MSELNLDLFTAAGDDFEKRQYLVLGSLKGIHREFQSNRLYPHLARLIELRASLKQILDGFSNLEELGPKRISRIDLKRQEIEFESVLPEQLDLSGMKNFIAWAKPLIDQAIEEGIDIYNFIDQNIEVNTVGIQPEYKDEGYLFIPNHEAGSTQLFRYEVSLFMNSNEPYRALKTRLLKSLKKSPKLSLSPGAVKLELIREFKDLPNPATFAFYSSLDLSFSSTLFPIAKRKLIRMIVC